VGDFWHQVARFVSNGSSLLFKYYATDRPAVATLKIYISGFDRLCATHFLTLLHPSLGFDPYIGDHWAISTYQTLC